MFHLDKKVAKSCKSFNCEYCDYNTSRKSSWEKHLITNKHKKNCFTFVSKSCKKVANLIFKCEICNKICKSRTTLWRHNKKCNPQNEFITIKKDKYIKVLENASNNQKTINNIQNQNNTQNISINLFLNEHCKNAMSLEDFIKGVNLTLEDINKNKDLGYADNMSNVLIKNLENIPNKERPIHSTDVKRLKFMVKKADGWEKDDGTEVDNAVRELKFKQINRINEWELKNPEFQEDPEKMEVWNKMMTIFNNGKNEKEKDKNSKVIKKKLAEVINIKDMLQEEEV